MSTAIQPATDGLFDIVIVGGGLVGSSLAALLAQSPTAKALRVAMIDGSAPPPHIDTAVSTENPQFDPRVVALTHASQALFATLGLWDNIADQRACAYTQMNVWDHDGTAAIHFSAQEIQQPHLGHIVENSLLQHALLDSLSHKNHNVSGVSILRGLRVEKIIHHDNPCDGESTATLVCDSGEEIATKLVVAADGGQSTIRQLSGMAVREWSYEHKAIVATVRCSKPHQFTAWQNFLPSGPLAFLPLEHASDCYCSIVWSLEEAMADQMMQLDDADFCQALGRAFQHRLGDVDYVSQRYCFPLHQRHAIDYVKENIVLIGDAAHTIHPLAGQGVNLGLLDAQALFAEIERGIERGLPVNDASLLRRYQRQRKSHNVEVMLLMEGLKRLFGSRDIVVRWLRNMGLRKVNHLKPLKQWLAKQAIVTAGSEKREQKK